MRGCPDASGQRPCTDEPSTAEQGPDDRCVVCHPVVVVRHRGHVRSTTPPEPRRRSVPDQTLGHPTKKPVRWTPTKAGSWTRAGSTPGARFSGRRWQETSRPRSGSTDQPSLSPNLPRPRPAATSAEIPTRLSASSTRSGSFTTSPTSGSSRRGGLADAAPGTGRGPDRRPRARRQSRRGRGVLRRSRCHRAPSRCCCDGVNRRSRGSARPTRTGCPAGRRRSQPRQTLRRGAR